MNYKLYCSWHIRLHLLALEEVQRSMVTITHVPRRRYGDFLMWFPMPLEKDKGLCTAFCTDTWLVQRRWHQVQCTPSLLLRKAAFEMGLCSEATVETAPTSPAHPTVTFSYPDSSKGKHKLPLTNSKMNAKIPAWSQHLHISGTFAYSKKMLSRTIFLLHFTHCLTSKPKLFPCASPCPVLRVVTRPKSKTLPVKNHTIGTEESRTNGRVRGTDRSPEITLPALYGTKNLLYLICCPSASAALPAQGEGPTCQEKQHRQHMLSAPRKCCHSNSTCGLLQLWKTKIFAFLDD